MNRIRPIILAAFVITAALLAYGLFTQPRPRNSEAEGFSSARVVKDIEVMSKEPHSVPSNLKNHGAHSPKIIF